MRSHSSVLYNEEREKWHNLKYYCSPRKKWECHQYPTTFKKPNASGDENGVYHDNDAITLRSYLLFFYLEEKALGVCVCVWVIATQSLNYGCTVAMVTYYATKMTITSSPIIGHLCDTNIDHHLIKSGSIYSSSYNLWKAFNKPVMY